MGPPIHSVQFNNEKGSLLSLISIIVALVIIGVVLWLINTYIPMDGKIKSLLNIVVIIAVILWLLKAFGIWSYLSHVHV